MLRQTSSKTEATQALLGLSTRQQIELERDVAEALLASSSTQPIEQRLEEKVASDVHLDQDLGEVQPMEEEQHLEAEKGNILPNTGPVIGLKIASLNIAEITRDLQGVQIDFMTPLDEETVSFEGLSNRYVKAKQQNTVLISRLRTRNIKLQSAVEKYWAMAEEPEDENKSKLFYETTSKLLREWDSSKWWLNVTKKKIKEEAIPDLPEKRDFIMKALDLEDLKFYIRRNESGLRDSEQFLNENEIQLTNTQRILEENKEMDAQTKSETEEKLKRLKKERDFEEAMLEMRRQSLKILEEQLAKKEKSKVTQNTEYKAKQRLVNDSKRSRDDMKAKLNELLKIKKDFDKKDSEKLRKVASILKIRIGELTRKAADFDNQIRVRFEDKNLVEKPKPNLSLYRKCLETTKRLMSEIQQNPSPERLYEIEVELISNIKLETVCLTVLERENLTQEDIKSLSKEKPEEPEEPPLRDKNPAIDEMTDDELRFFGEETEANIEEIERTIAQNLADLAYLNYNIRLGFFDQNDSELAKLEEEYVSNVLMLTILKDELKRIKNRIITLEIMVESRQQQMSKSKRKKTAERSEDKKRRGEVRLSDQSPTQSIALTMPYIPTIAEVVHNSQHSIETLIITPDYLNDSVLRLREEGNEMLAQMWQQIDVRIRIMTELEMLLQEIRAVLQSYSLGNQSVLLDFRGFDVEIPLNNYIISSLSNRDTEIGGALNRWNQLINLQVSNSLFWKGLETQPLFHTPHPYPEHSYSRPLTRRISITSSSRIPQLPTVEDYIRDIQNQTNRQFLIPSPINYRSVIESNRKKGNYLNIKQWEQLNTPEGRQRLIDKLYELLDSLNQVINDYSSERQVVIEDILIDQRIVSQLEVRRQEIVDIINSWRNIIRSSSIEQQKERTTLGQSTSIHSRTEITRIETTRGTIELPTIEDLIDSFQYNRIVTIPSPEMVSSQIQILKDQKKDNEAKEWEKLTTWTGIQRMIKNLRALTKAIKKAIERYKTSESGFISDRKFATALVVKLKEILEVIFRWEQRQSHLPQLPSPTGIPTTAPSIPRAPTTVPTIPQLPKVGDLIRDSYNENERPIFPTSNTMEGQLRRADIQSIIQKLNLLLRSIQAVIGLTQTNPDIVIEGIVINQNIVQRLNVRMREVEELIDMWCQRVV
jgi:hypothetical protein